MNKEFHKLESEFNKNGIQYKLLIRDNNIALFQLFLDNEVVGYEVCQIIRYEEYEKNGVIIPAGEHITGNEQFGKDLSRAFFPNEPERAEKYFNEVRQQVKIRKNSGSLKGKTAKISA